MICKIFCCGLFTKLMNNIHLNQASFVRTVNCRTGWKRQPNFICRSFHTYKNAEFLKFKISCGLCAILKCWEFDFKLKVKKNNIKFVPIIRLYNTIDNSFLFKNQFYKLDLESWWVFTNILQSKHIQTSYVIKWP